MSVKQKSLKFNFVMNASLSMSAFIFPLITFPYVSRVLLPSGNGKISFATSVVSYFQMLAQLGIPTYGIRACAKVRDDKEALTQVTQELLGINLVTSLLSYVLLAVAVIFVPRLREERNLYVILSITIFLSAIGMEWLYKALEEYAYITVRSILFKLLALIAMFMLIHRQEDYVLYGVISILASSASNILNFINVRKYIDLKLQKSYNFKRHFKPIAVFFAMSCATTVYTHLDEAMLGFLASYEDVGYYHAAVKIKMVLVSLITSLGAVLLPRVSYYLENGFENAFYAINKKAINFVMILAAPTVLYFILYAKQGIVFLSGEAYLGAIRPMRIIMPTVILIGITNILGIQMLVPLGREKMVLYSEIAGAVTDLGLNAILIPKYASSGAAFGTLVAEVVVLLVQVFVLWKDIKNVLLKISYFKILLGLIGGTVLSVWILRFNIGNLLTLVSTAVLFLGAYGGILLLLHESLAGEMADQAIGMVKGRKKKDG